MALGGIYRRHGRPGHGGNRARVALGAGLLTALLAALSPLYAQAIPSAAPDMQAPVADGPVYAVAHAPGGLTYIGGDFSHVGPRAGRGVPFASPATNATGLDLVQGPKPSTSGFPEVSGGEIKAVEPDGNGGWYIGGTFTTVVGPDGVPRNVPRLAHIRPGGQLNTGWRPNPGPDSSTTEVLALTVGEPNSVSGRVLYVGGDFHSIHGATKDYLAAFPLDSTTRAPTSEAPLAWAPAPSDAGGAIRAIATVNVTVNAPTAKSVPVVFAGGAFTKIGAGAPENIQKLAGVWGPDAVIPDGSTDPDSDPDQVSGAEVKPGTTSWNPGMPTGASTVREIEVSAVQSVPVGSNTVVVYAAGDFVGTNMNHLAAIQFQVPAATATVVNAAPYSNWDAVTDSQVRDLALDEGATPPVLYAGGDFTKAGTGTALSNATIDRGHLAAFRAIGANHVGTTGCSVADCAAEVQSWAPQANGSAVNGLSLASGHVVAGGDFSMLNSARRNGLGAVAAAGTANEGQTLSWDPMLAGGAVNATASGGGNVYAGGAFSSVGASERNNIAAIDSAGNVAGILGTGTACDTAADPGCHDRVVALTLSSDSSRLFVGGAFTKIEGADKVHLAALDAQSGNVVGGWTADADYFKDGNPDGTGWVMALEGAGNTLYAGGNFNRIGGAARSKLAAVDMTSGDVLNWLPEPECASEPCSIHAIEASCGTVYAGGNSIESIGGQPRNRLAALVPVGLPGAGQATPWDPKLNQGSGGRVLTLARIASTIYVGGGGISSIGGATRKGIAAIDAGTAQAVDGWSPSAEGTVEAIDVSADGSTVYLGGQFDSIRGRSDVANLGAVQAVGVGDGQGGVVPWITSPRGEITASGPDLGGRPVTYALDAVGDSVYVGGKFAEMGSRTQSGFSAFTSGPDPAGAEPEVCAHEVKAAPPAPPAAPAPIEVPRITDVRLTRKLKLLYTLSIPATVEIGLDRKVKGFELPAPKPGKESAAGAGGKGSEAAERPTVCKRATKRNRRAATRIVKKKLGGKLRKASPRQRKKMIRKRLRKMRCTTFKDVTDLSDAGEQGGNAVSLRPKKSKKGKKRPKLPRARYRVTLLPLTEASGPGSPVGLDFRVLRSGLAETTAGGGGEAKEGTSR